MYETLITDVTADIEQKTFKDNVCLIKGWAFSNKHGVCPIKCKWDGVTKNITINARTDISDKFNRKTIVLCGWEIEVPSNKYCDLQIKLGTEWVTFMTFNTNIPKSDEPVKNEIITPPTTSTDLNSYIDTALADFYKKHPEATPNTTRVLKIGFSITAEPRRDIIVIDNFYNNPDEIREFALTTINDKETMANFVKTLPVFKNTMEVILGKHVVFDKYANNGEVQLTIAGNNIIIECGKSQYGGILFLTPNAPVNGGITLYRSRNTGKMTVDDTDKDKVFQNGNLDTTEFEPVDVIGNVYNRLVIFNTQLIHAISHNFGNTPVKGRLVQTFAFDLADTTKISLTV
jgi:hypothetical protein